MPNVELYDHKTDIYENNNISLINPKITESLLPILEKGNTGLYKTKPFNKKQSAEAP
jgi:hypothetical protein